MKARPLYVPYLTPSGKRVALREYAPTAHTQPTRGDVTSFIGLAIRRAAEKEKKA